MRKYCKAYHLKDMRQFPAWSAYQGEERVGGRHYCVSLG